MSLKILTVAFLRVGATELNCWIESRVSCSVSQADRLAFRRWMPQNWESTSEPLEDTTSLVQLNYMIRALLGVQGWESKEKNDED